MTPPKIIVITWLTYLFAVLFFAQNYNISLLAIASILIFLIIYVIGFKLANKKYINDMHIREGEIVNSELVNKIIKTIYISTFSGFISIAILINWVGHNILDIILLNGVDTLIMELTSMRYTEGYSQPIIYSLTSYGMQIGVVLGGFLYAISPKHKIISLIPFLPILITTILKAQRGTILMAIVLFIGSILPSYAWNHNYRLLLKKIWLKFLIGIIILLTILFAYILLQNLRDGGNL